MPFLRCWKKSHSKIPIILRFGQFCPWSNSAVQLKSDFLPWPFLNKSNDAPSKYMSNGVCAYKELAIWTKYVVVMASWLRSFLKFTEPYLANRTLDFQVLGLFGKVRTRSTTFMLNNFSFEASLDTWSWGQKLSIFGNFNYKSLSIFGSFCPDLIFFIFKLCNVI